MKRSLDVVPFVWVFRRSLCVRQALFIISVPILVHKIILDFFIMSRRQEQAAGTAAVSRVMIREGHDLPSRPAHNTQNTASVVYMTGCFRATFRPYVAVRSQES